MKTGAISSDVMLPFSHPVPWRARRKRGRKSAVVVAQSWFDARALGMAELGVGPDDLTVAAPRSLVVARKRGKGRR